MDLKYTIKGNWSTGDNGELLYTAFAIEKNVGTKLAKFTTEIPLSVRKKWGDQFLKKDTEISTKEHISHIIPKI